MISFKFDHFENSVRKCAHDLPCAWATVAHALKSMSYLDGYCVWRAPTFWVSIYTMLEADAHILECFHQWKPNHRKKVT